nr:amino acid adenylation domain-containing protein [Acidobacteriota bacterium]
LYNMPIALRVEGELSVAVLTRVLGEVVRRHEVLRTVFREEDGLARQVIRPPGGFAVPLVDLLALPPALREPVAEGLVKEEARRPFDLARGPLLRVGLWRLGEAEHVLLFALHHIITDGWSMGVLVREVTALYTAFSSGQPSPLAELPVQYADFAAWQRSWLSGEALEGEVAYWRRRLSGAPPVLELAADRPRPAVQSFRGAARRLSLSAALSEDLLALARREGATLFMTLFSAFGVLLYRLTGQPDFTVGTVVAGRNYLEIENLIGFFVNTLVLRPDLSADPRFTVLLSRVRREALQAFAHQDLPFEKLVEELAPERSPAFTPLFQVMLVLQNEEIGELVLPGLRLVPLELPESMAKFDLTLTMEQGERGELAGVLGYNTDLFDAPTAERLLGHFAQLLKAVVAAPERPLASLPLLAAAESCQLLLEWNDTTCGLPETTLYELFTYQAGRHPGYPAVVCGQESLTYAALGERARHLSRRLRALGIAPEEPVALYFDRGTAAVVAILGVLGAGGAYMPFDVGNPKERLATLWENAGRPLLLTERRLVPGLASLAMGSANVLCLDELDGSELAAESRPSTPLHRVDPLSLAYVLHTSGSTGTPKGVCCTQRGVINLLADFERRQPLAAGSRGSLWTSLSFDVSVYEIFSPLLAGGAVHIVPEEVRQDTDRFMEWLAQERIESAYVPPFMVPALRQRLESAPAAIPLCRLLVGVEPIAEAHLARLAELRPGLAVLNGYGPTEATICATLHGVDRQRRRSSGSPITPIGRPVANSAIYLLDGGLLPVPMGAPGELYIAGAGLARGYLRQPQATAERFVPNPWSEVGGERLYRTGDLARLRPDGNLEFLGRIDRQVKLRGFRIELGEIEAALAQQPGVGEAAVVVRESPAGGRGLVAYVVAEPGAELSELSGLVLRKALQAKLPEYMVPAQVMLLPALPLTPNGKLDRRWLAEHGPLPGVPATDAPRR